MKKRAIISLLMVLVMCLCACTGGGTTDNDPYTDNNEVSSTPEPGKPTDSPVQPQATEVPAKPEQNSQEATQAPAETDTTGDAEQQDGTDGTDGTNEDAVTDTIDQQEGLSPEGTDSEASGTEIAGADGQTIGTKELFAAYNQYVHDFVQESDYECDMTLRVALGFVDDDDIPELLIAEGNYHACGVSVCSYINGEVIEVGQFGEFGSFSYINRINWIYSFYMGMGIEQLSKWSIAGNEAVCDMSIVHDYNEYKYYSGDNEVDEQTYQLAYEAIHAPAQYEGNTTVYVNYEDMLSFYPNFSFGYSEDVFAQMYAELLDGGILSAYIAPEMLDMTGEWALTYLSYYSHSDNKTYIYDENKPEESDIVANSAVSVFPGLAGYWLSIYDNDMEDIAFYSDYACRMIYSPLGISEDIDYGWNAELADTSELKVYLTMPDDASVILSGTVMYEALGEGEKATTVYAVYKKDYTADSYHEIYAEISRNASDDRDGMNAYTVKELQLITWEDSELIAEYGLPEDLDGYDFEVVEKKGVEPYTILFDENTEILLFDYDKTGWVKSDAETLNGRLDASQSMAVYMYFEISDVLELASVRGIDENEAARLLVPVAVKNDNT